MTPELVKRLFVYRDGNLYWAMDRGSNAREGEQAGRLLRTGYRSIHISGRKYQEHRLIFLYHHGYLPEQIDHINRVKSDNRIENLRASDYSSNQINTEDRTPYRGVRRRKSRWEARAWKNGRTISIGMFNNPEDAARAAVEARRLLHDSTGHPTQSPLTDEQPRRAASPTRHLHTHAGRLTGPA